jgi:hypothetical protein
MAALIEDSCTSAPCSPVAVFAVQVPGESRRMHMPSPAHRPHTSRQNPAQSWRYDRVVPMKIALQAPAHSIEPNPAPPWLLLV